MKRKILLLLAVLSLLVVVLSVAAAGQEKTVAIPQQERSATETFAASEKAILYIRGYDAAGTLLSTGSGFIVRTDGLALSAAHVVDGMAKMTAILRDGKELSLTLVSVDKSTDTAVLRLPQGKYDCLTLASKEPAFGAVVRAIGYPAKETVMITEGIVNNPSAVVAEKNRMMVSCEIVSGMSGGPVLDAFGQVVGIVSGSVRTMNGIHLSVRTDAMLAALAEEVGT